MAHVSTNHKLRYGARRLYYRVRDLIAPYTDATLTDTYFRDDLLQQYQREYGKLRGLYTMIRGAISTSRTADVR